MLVEIKISYDPSTETLDQAIASLSKNAPVVNAANKVNAVEPKADKRDLNVYATPQGGKTDKAPAVEETPAPAETPKAEESKPAPVATVAKTDIRAIATAISKAGKKTELKAALEAFGATKLSDMSEADYPALKERLEAINA